jgi:hypothetical protein
MTDVCREIRVRMARNLRLEYPRATYHVINRGDWREAIFEDDQDRERFRATLGQACPKTGLAGAWPAAQSYLVVETPAGQSGSRNEVVSGYTVCESEPEGT